MNLKKKSPVGSTATWDRSNEGATVPRVLEKCGKTLCDVEDTNPAAPGTGVIAFSISTGAAIEFKEVRLKRLNPVRQ
jgi:hypothetical protein